MNEEQVERINDFLERLAELSSNYGLSIAGNIVLVDSIRADSVKGVLTYEADHYEMRTMK